MAVHRFLPFAFGLLGNIVSFITFLAPLPTFCKIYKRRSTEGFQSIPYVVSLLSAMLLIYYGLIKKDILLIIINGIGCAIETAYIAAYLVYASPNARRLTMKLVLCMNGVGYGMVLCVTLFLSKGPDRARTLGWICMAFSLSVFAAPLCIVRKVIKTKSVEFMPFTLSLFLTMGAIVWFFYGFLKQDYFIAVPNVLGFIFGVVQMMLYAVYKKGNGKVVLVVEAPNNDSNNGKLQELREDIIDVVKLSAVVCQELNPVLAAQLKDVLKDSVAAVAVAAAHDQILDISPKHAALEAIAAC